MHGSLLQAIDSVDEKRSPISVASLLDHMDWMTDRMISEEMSHLLAKMDMPRGRIFWRSYADNVHSAQLQWLNPTLVAHADDEDSDDRVSTYWTTWLARTKDLTVAFEQRRDTSQDNGAVADLKTAAKVVLYPLWKHVAGRSVDKLGHAKDMESFYKFQKEGYDALRERMLHARPILMESLPLNKDGGMVWVDIGAGTARNLEYLSPETIRKYFKAIYVVDISPSLLEIAQRRCVSTNAMTMRS